MLDVGCGVGRHVRLFAREGFDAYGLDHSASGIDACQQMLAAERLTARVWCGEMDDIPYPDGFFDAIIAFNSIYHGTIDRISDTVGLIHAKLRHHGLCFVTFPSRDNRMYGKGTALGPHTFVSPGMFGGILGHDGERGIPHHFCSETELRSLFQQFDIESLEHRELELPSSRSEGNSVSWFRIPKAFFWRIVARRRTNG